MARFWRLSPAIALATAVLLLLAGLMMAYYNERSYHAQQLSEVGVQAQILAAAVTAALVFDDSRTAQEYVNALKANREVHAAAVYDEQGALLASYARDGTRPLPPRADASEPHLEDLYVAVAKPVVHGDEVVGTVYLRTLMEPLDIRLARYGGVALLITMASLVVVVLGAAHRALTRANAELEMRAFDLADANRKLLAQIEERERAEEALRQSQKMEAIGQLSGGIAHDFNNLLTVVRGNLQLLQRRIAEGRTDVGQYVDFAMDGLSRASNVTQRILAFSRRQPLSPKPVDLSRLVADMGELVRHSTGELIAVEMRLGADWWTECDPNQMENVVLNLVINARDAMPDGGRLVVETANLRLDTVPDGFEGIAPGDYVSLSIADSGFGMSAEVRAKAIEPFFTTKPEGQGTGLGLSMIFGYIKQSDGALRIESELGKGTRITILMPRHRGPVEAPAESAMPAVPRAEPLAAAPARKPNVLLVEDEALVRMVAVEAMRDEGFTVFEEGDGSDALAVLMAEEIDLLVTDVKLPGMDGYRLAEAGRAHRPGLKVLLMTGYSKNPIPEELALAGVKLVHKPYDLDHLVATARDMLREKTA